MGCSAGNTRRVAARRGTSRHVAARSTGAPKNTVPLHIVKQTWPRHVQKQRSGQTPRHVAARRGTSRHVAARYCFRRGFCSKIRPNKLGLYIFEPTNTCPQKGTEESGGAAGKLDAHVCSLRRSFGSAPIVAVARPRHELAGPGDHAS